MSSATHCANCGAEVPAFKPHRVGECHPPTATLTQAESAAIEGAVLSPWMATPVIVQVERIIADRLARIEALAEKWNGTPDYDRTEYDRGRVDQRHDMTTELYEVLGGLRPIR